MIHGIILWWMLLQSKQTGACYEKCWSQSHKWCDIVTDPPNQNYDIRDDEKLPLDVLVSRYQCKDK